MELTASETRAIISAFSACSSEGIGPELTRELAVKLGMDFRHYLFPRNAEEQEIVYNEQKAVNDRLELEKMARQAAWDALTPEEQEEKIAAINAECTRRQVVGGLNALQKEWN